MTSRVSQCREWVSDHDSTGPTSQRCRKSQGHSGPCVGLTIGVDMDRLVSIVRRQTVDILESLISEGELTPSMSVQQAIEVLRS